MNVLIVGYGKMGRLVEELAAGAGMTIAGCVDVDGQGWAPADVAIDFSTADALKANFARYVEMRMPVVIGTTGWGDVAPTLQTAATSFVPSRKMACASTVAVVVPSPAVLPVRTALSSTSCAPMFANDSGSSISSATVTPSFVTSGAPCIGRSRKMFRPSGPSVGLTAPASTRDPASKRARPSSPNRNRFAAIF